MEAPSRLDTLPNEITQMILEWATRPRTAKDGVGMITHVVCQYVTKLWKSLLPPIESTFPSAYLTASPFIKKWSYTFSTIAAREGYLSLLQWGASGPQYFHCGEETTTNAAEGGHLEVLKWLRWHWCPWNEQLVSIHAARGGHLEMLKWTRENKCDWDARACAAAAQHGHFELLKWARENGCPWDYWTANNAAARGDIAMLEWVHSQGGELDEYVCSSAANLETLKWLREHGCPWESKRSCRSFASTGKLDMLEWAVENGLPWHPTAGEVAAWGGYKEVLMWAIEKGLPIEKSPGKVCAEAAHGGHFEMLKWLRDEGYTWERHTCSLAAKEGHWEVLKWAVENGCPLSFKTLRAVRKFYGEEIEVQKWLIEHRCPTGN
jgi:hypothetical protein